MVTFMISNHQIPIFGVECNRFWPSFFFSLLPVGHFCGNLMKQSVTAPPPRSWSQTEGYVEPQKDNESTDSPLSSTSGGAHLHNGHARRPSDDSNYEADAPIGIDTSRTPEPLELLRSTDFTQQNFEMNKEELSAFAKK
jgi:hypothetical protein